MRQYIEQQIVECLMCEHVAQTEEKLKEHYNTKHYSNSPHIPQVCNNGDSCWFLRKNKCKFSHKSGGSSSQSHEKQNTTHGTAGQNMKTKSGVQRDLLWCRYQDKCKNQEDCSKKYKHFNVNSLKDFPLLQNRGPVQ